MKIILDESVPQNLVADRGRPYGRDGLVSKLVSSDIDRKRKPIVFRFIDDTPQTFPRRLVLHRAVRYNSSLDGRRAVLVSLISKE